MKKQILILTTLLALSFQSYSIEPPIGENALPSVNLD
jgi:hypothetical protein